jgi:hypothetical protein
MASSGILCRVVLTKATWHNIPEDAIYHSHRRENLKSDITPIFIKTKQGFLRTDNSNPERNLIRYLDTSHRELRRGI